jgi:hypothetical protein
MYKRGHVDEVISLILLHTVSDVEQTRIWRPVTMIPVGSGTVDSDDLASGGTELSRCAQVLPKSYPRGSASAMVHI